MRPLVAIVGMDTVREKLLYQTRWLSDHGFDVHILTMHRDPGSIGEDPSATIEQVQAPVGRRLLQVGRFLLRHRRDLHHVELYVGGRFAFVYALLCRVMRVKLLVVERGDLLLYQRRVYSRAMRFSIRLSYQLAHRIWYKELYMAPAFERWGLADRAFLLPNAVPMPRCDSSMVEARTVDFLWANRLVPERHPDWFADALAAVAGLRPVRAGVLGFSAGVADPRIAELEARVRARLAGIETARLLEFTDPSPFYERSRFFVLPADVVFANFSLLEAMSHGVVPIVSDVEGADRIVRDGQNGLLVAHRPDAWLSALERALETDAGRWHEMSGAARATVEESYSIEAWGRALLEQYELLRSRQLSALRTEKRADNGRLGRSLGP